MSSVYPTLTNINFFAKLRYKFATENTSGTRFGDSPRILIPTIQDNLIKSVQLFMQGTKFVNEQNKYIEQCCNFLYRALYNASEGCN